jgi:hypothetical protein
MFDLASRRSFLVGLAAAALAPLRARAAGPSAALIAETF